MFFQHIYDKGLAQASYMIGCQATGTAVVIDAKRDIDTYLEIATREKLKITHVTETHIHADFLSGTRELSAVTGAEILLSDEGGSNWQYEFPHTGLKNGDSFMVGNLKLEVLHTPGHTPEHISFLLTDTKAGDKPVMIFTGDFMFVGDIGRPDLLEKAAGIRGTQELGARQMFQSLKKFRALPEYVQVWPGHGAGSACGKALGAVPSSTVGYELLTNWAFRYTDEASFVKVLLEGQPEPPKYFAMMKKLNKVTRELLPTLPTPRELNLVEFEKALQRGMTVIDTRNKTEFAQGHIPGSINIQDNNAFSTWAGWVVDYDQPFVLIVSPSRLADITRALIRIGLDNIYGYIPGVEVWSKAGKSLATTKEVTVDELRNLLEKNNLRVIDVRGDAEFKSAHLPKAMNIHAGYLLQNINQLPKDQTLVLQCQGGDRSAIAYSLLAKQGFTNIVNLAGGIDAWLAKGFHVERN